MTVPSPLHVVQLSDTHLFADLQGALVGLNTADSLQAVITQIAQLDPRPDLLLLTGDLSQDETAQSYTHLRDWLAALSIQSYWLPGNHDHLATMKAVLTSSELSALPCFQMGGWQFLLLNSQVPGQVHGELSSETLEWLDQQLEANASLPTLIALHHPPFPVEADWLDSSRLANPEDLFAVIDRHPQVKLVIFGHIHQEFSFQRQGVQYLSCPSTCIQFHPRTPTFTIDQIQPGFRCFQLYADGRFSSEVRRVTFAPQPDLAAQGY